MYDELYNPISYEWGNITDKEEIIRILNTYIDNYLMYLIKKYGLIK